MWTFLPVLRAGSVLLLSLNTLPGASSIHCLSRGLVHSSPPQGPSPPGHMFGSEESHKHNYNATLKYGNGAECRGCGSKQEGRLCSYGK